MKFTLRQIAIFLATAQSENISQAATALNMSQSAASGALKELELQFDVQLFDRVGKRLQINELGRHLRPKAEALLAQATELEHEFAQHRHIGSLKIGATLTIGNYLAVGLINEYLRDQRDARVKLEVANTANISKMLTQFDIDLGLIEGELTHPDLDVVPWREDQMICFCAPGHPLANNTQLSDQDLCSAKWILREQGSGTRQTFDRAMHGLLSKLDISLELQHTEAIKRSVEAGLGISCLSTITLEDAFKRGSLVPLSTPTRDLSRQFYLVTHKHKYRSAGILRWLDICGLGER